MMAKDTVRLALVGAGGMANSVHYPSLAEMDDVEMVGLCDLVEEKLNETADTFEIENRYTNYKKMLEETDPDGVYILMPPHHLFDLVIHSLNEKLHVFIEKPPGITAEQTRQMANLAEKNGCLTMVGFNRRFIPAFRRCRNMVRDEGPMNQCVSTFYKYHAAGPYYDGATDILSCDAVHAVDALRFMGGDVEKVVSSVRDLGMDFDTSFTALCEFESGAVGVLLANWQTGAREHTFELHGAGISAFVNLDEEVIINRNNERRDEVFTAQEAADSDERHHFYGFFGENRHFVDCIQNNQEPETCLRDAVKTMELVDRIYHNPM
ncbi:MAG: Gfo/Idh/MocA family oxidoreductase [Armatimonadota bacterium]